MIANDILLDAFTRVYESLHRTLGDITPDELTKEPHPSIGWLAWRISRVMDNNVSRLSGREQLWIGDGWAARFGMPPEPSDYARSAMHTREQVRAFRASAQQLLDYHDAAYERMKTYLDSLSADDLARQLDEPAAVEAGRGLPVGIFGDATYEDVTVALEKEFTLVAMSGDTASFLAGGEFPVPVPQNSGSGTGGRNPPRAGWPSTPRPSGGLTSQKYSQW